MTPRGNPRKLTPEEIARYQKSQFTVKATLDTSKFIVGIENAQLKLWQLQVDERLSAIESDNDIMQKRLTEIERTEQNQWDRINRHGNKIHALKERLDVLEGERPEVCECNMHPSEFHISIMRTDGVYANHYFTCAQEAIDWTKKVLDGMMSGKP